MAPRPGSLYAGIQTGTLQDLTYVPNLYGNVQEIVDNLDFGKNKSFPMMPSIN